MADDLEDRIEEAAAGPAEAESDGQKVKQQPLKDLIEADKYLAKKAATSKPHMGLRITKLRMPGARGGETE